MALLLAWVSLGTCTFLASILFVLIIDTRGDRRALGSAQQSIAALQRRVAAQDEQIGDLRALLGLPEMAPEQVPRTSARQGLLLPASTQRAPFAIPRKTVITAMPEGNTRPTPCPAPRPNVHIPSGMNERIADRYVALCEASEAREVPATHCERGHCFRGTPDVCLCRCDACVRATDCLVQAQQEIAAERRGADAVGFEDANRPG